LVRIAATGAVLMSANDGTIDHDVFRVGLLGQYRQQLGPDAFFRPPAEPAMNVAEVAVFFRKVTPGNSCPVSVQNSVYKQAVISRRDSNMTSPTGEHIFDTIPLVVANTHSQHGSILQ
jgi:hypothetical protein